MHPRVAFEARAQLKGQPGAPQLRLDGHISDHGGQLKAWWQRTAVRVQQRFGLAEAVQLSHCATPDGWPNPSTPNHLALGVSS